MTRKTRTDTVTSQDADAQPGSTEAGDATPTLATAAGPASPATPPNGTPPNDRPRGDTPAAAEPPAFDADGPMPEAGGRFMRMADGSLSRIEEDE